MTADAQTATDTAKVTNTEITFVPKNFDQEDLNLAQVEEVKISSLAITIDGIEDKENYDKAVENRKLIKKMRGALKKRSDEFLEPAKKFMEQVKGYSTKLKDPLDESYTHLDGQIKKVDDEKERIAEEERKKEAIRVHDLKEQLVENGWSWANPTALACGEEFISADSIGELTEEEFAEKIEIGKAKLKADEDARIKAEEEAEKARKLQEENEAKARDLLKRERVMELKEKGLYALHKGDDEELGSISPESWVNFLASLEREKVALENKADEPAPVSTPPRATMTPADPSPVAEPVKSEPNEPVKSPETPPSVTPEYEIVSALDNGDLEVKVTTNGVSSLVIYRAVPTDV